MKMKNIQEWNNCDKSFNTINESEISDTNNKLTDNLFNLVQQISKLEKELTTTFELIVDTNDKYTINLQSDYIKDSLFKEMTKKRMDIQNFISDCAKMKSQLAELHIRVKKFGAELK